MSFIGKFISSGLFVNLCLGVVLLLLGFHLIKNNIVITKNLFQNVGIFETKEVKKTEKEIPHSKYITSRIIVYFAGSSFVVVGLMALRNAVKSLIVK